ncbi:MAG TPA: YggT family protein [Gammaproteobacteria bacterium]|nr:YggT family protein [Gammaproteobacteria bacterium]
MNGGYVSNAGTFLLDVIFGLFIGAVMLRLFLQWARADFYNPLSQAIVKLTNPVLRPLRRFIPAIGRIDSASVVLVVVLQMFAVWLKLTLVGASAGVGAIAVFALAEIVSKAIYIFMFAIFVQVIASWVAPGSYNPVLSLIDSITDPLLKPLRAVVPPLGGLDLTPMIALIALQLAQMLVVAPLRDVAMALL